MHQNGLRILVIRLFALGDVVRILPIIQLLREAYPNVRLDCAVRRCYAEVLRGHPCIDNLYELVDTRRLIHKIWTRLKFFTQLMAFRYDIVVVLHQEAWVTPLTKILFPLSDCYGFGGYSPKLHMRRTQRKQILAMGMNYVDELFEICRPLVRASGLPTPKMFISRHDRRAIEHFVASRVPHDRLFVLVHVPVINQVKQWPLEKFAALCDMLAYDGRFTVMLSWGPGQRRIVDSLLSLTKTSPILAPAPRSLKRFAWLTRCADAFIGPDTGPMHIASVMGTPVVAIFGGSNPRHDGPYFSPSRILEASKNPATPPRCKEPACLILNWPQPQEVFEALLDLLMLSKDSPGEVGNCPVRLRRRGQRLEDDANHGLPAEPVVSSMMTTSSRKG